MNAVEQIQAAIAKLTAIQQVPPVVVNFRETDDPAMNEWFARAEAKLAMFHRTIDAQIAILQVPQLAGKCTGVVAESVWHYELALARAINGATS